MRSGKTRDSEFDSFELNLVLHDGNRINIIDHADEPTLRQDAATLTEFLGVEVWDEQG